MVLFIPDYKVSQTNSKVVTVFEYIRHYGPVTWTIENRSILKEEIFACFFLHSGLYSSGITVLQ